jgi:hypothetical protein
LFDISQYKHPTDTPMAERVRAHNVGIDLTALAQGVGFFHAGVDMLRSKSLDRDSYNSGDWFNKLDFTYQANNWGVGLPVQGVNSDNWPLMQPLLADPALNPGPNDIEAVVTHMQEILQIRRTSPLFHLQTAAEVQNRLQFHNTGSGQIPGLVVMSLSDQVEPDLDPARETIVSLFNAGDEAQTIILGDFVGRALALHPVQANSADDVVKTSSFDSTTGSFTVPARTTAVFVEKESAVAINRWLRLMRMRFSYSATPVANAPAGVFTISATFQNWSPRTFSDPFFEVVLLTGGNVVLNAQDGPGGIGSIVPVPYQMLGGNGLWDPGEQVTIPFRIGLVKKWPFLFLVSAQGILLDGGLTNLSLEAPDTEADEQFEFDITAEDFERGNSLYLPLIYK